MNSKNSAIAPGSPPLSTTATTASAPRDAPSSGLAWGALGILAFSWTVPLTRVAVTGGLSPELVGYGRAIVPGILAVVLLWATRQRRPRGAEWISIAVVAGGSVIGFPILTSNASQTVPAAHSAVVIGLLPLTTAAFGVLRTGERPRVGFWLASIAGAIAVVAFVGLDHGRFGAVGTGDLLLAAAVLVCALGYMEGGVLARTLGSWQTICWALVTASPVMATLTWATVPDLGAELRAFTPSTGVAFAYLSLVSMFLGFFAWYHGLGIGPVSRVSQVQLLQPILSILWAAAIVGERPGHAVYLGAVVVLALAATAVRARSR